MLLPSNFQSIKISACKVRHTQIYRCRANSWHYFFASKQTEIVLKVVSVSLMNKTWYELVLSNFQFEPFFKILRWYMKVQKRLWWKIFSNKMIRMNIHKNARAPGKVKIWNGKSIQTLYRYYKRYFLNYAIWIILFSFYFVHILFQDVTSLF